ncbi:hypothetical protein [Streptomyces longhuiensis]|uniref:hypothetical protein n=1 Tax=Streptomyces longhuiensis TaxID=2880933 RepID=UPI001D0B68CD|nr:hypothetical protein [Streptomyces longhuiensis]UDM00052.1 hypothetical protein LGI35_18085 [Streptomyces longhuiensis]
MTTTATHLRTIALHWEDLHDAAGQPVTVGAFGLGLRGYLARLDELDAEQAEYERHQAAHRRSLERDPIQLGDRPVPVRLHILDTMRAIEAALHGTADQIAAAVQRTPMPLAPSSWPAADKERRNQLARADAADPRRWRWTGRRRPAPYTALWLLARVEARPGPFRALTEQEAALVGATAAGAAGRVERALDIAAQRRTLAQRCACGGEIDMHGGEGRPPVAHCVGCGRIWTEAGVVAA